MPRKSATKSSKVEAQSLTKKPAPKTDADKIRVLEEQLAQREAELAVINSIQTALASKMDFQGIIDAVGDKLGEIFIDGNVGIALVDKARNVAIVPYVVENGKRVEYFEVRLDVPSVFQHLIKRRRPILINTKFRERFGGDAAITFPGRDQRDLKSWLSVPIINGDEFIGGISLRNWQRENAFTESDVRLLQTIANSMSVALENVRLFDETQRLLKETEQRAAELQIINNIGQTLTEGLDLNRTLERVGERLRSALKVDNIAIAVTDGDTGAVQYISGNRKSFTPDHFSFSKFKLGVRLSMRGLGRSWVVNTNVEKSWRKFAPSTEVDEIPKAFILLPLLVSGEAIGGITIADYENEDAFTDISVNLLETIASNMGTAIQNVRLFDETQRLLKETEQRATELQIINNVGQTITGELDLNTLIEHVGDKLREAFNVGNIRIAVVDEKTGLLISPYVYRHGKRVELEENWQEKAERYKLAMRASVRTGLKTWVVNNNAEKNWRKFASVVDAEDVPKSFVMLPLLAGTEVIGGITIPNYEEENAFSDFSIGMLETIASNMGTAIQNVRLFEETKRLFAEAEEARAAAEQANKAKSTFLANMSHELRTPLNAIMGFTQIVKGKAEGVMPEKQVNNLDKVLTSSQHLLGLINTVLDIAKIEAGRMDVIPGKFSLGGFADQCMALATPLLKPNVTLEKQVDETIGFVFSDQDKIKQIILNLLSNAAKFTHEGKIILKVEKLDGEMISVSVKDSGIGISEEAVGRVFEEFQQAETTTTRQYGGTGLGLTISRNLARLLGGDLTATSVLGEGSTFTLTFPIKYQKNSASSAAIVEPVHSVDTTSIESHNKLEEKSEPQSRNTILVVEDTELNISFITQLLEDDYNLIFAKNGAQGVTLAELEKPDLILMDISLPIMDGYEATRRIRGSMADIPIIGLSAYAMVGDAEKAKAAGCNDYVTKPVDGNLLKQKIKNYLR